MGELLDPVFDLVSRDWSLFKENVQTALFRERFDRSH